MNFPDRLSLLVSTAALFAVVTSATAFAQKDAEKKPPSPGPMLDEGIQDYDTPDFTLSLVRSSQTIASLKPKGANGFDFTPGDLLVARSQNGYFHLGDLTLRLRTQKSREWMNYSTATTRRTVRTLPATGSVLAAADLTSTLPGDMPLQITRSWVVENGKLVLRFVLKNKSPNSVHIGAFGNPHDLQQRPQWTLSRAGACHLLLAPGKRFRSLAHLHVKMQCF